MTFSTWQRRRLFIVESYVRLLLRTLYRHRRDGRYRMHAFVLMPEHIHLLLTPARDLTLEHAIQLIKGSYSHALGAEIGRKREIWQRGFTDHRIRDASDFEGHREYIHQNPVKRGLVEHAHQYRYSSAFPGFKLDLWHPPSLRPKANLHVKKEGPTSSRPFNRANS